MDGSPKPMLSIAAKIVNYQLDHLFLRIRNLCFWFKSHWVFCFVLVGSGVGLDKGVHLSWRTSQTSMLQAGNKQLSVRGNLACGLIAVGSFPPPNAYGVPACSRAGRFWSVAISLFHFFENPLKQTVLKPSNWNTLTNRWISSSHSEK